MKKLFTPLESPAACSGDEDLIPFRANTGFNAPCEPPRWKVEDFLTGFTYQIFCLTIGIPPNIFKSRYSHRIPWKSTHSTPRSEAWGMLRVDTERRFLPRFKNRGLAPSNVSKFFLKEVIYAGHRTTNLLFRAGRL